ncbi:MAG: extracellular solute-binding protein [Pseudomonadota bacterium]
MAGGFHRRDLLRTGARFAAGAAAFGAIGIGRQAWADLPTLRATHFGGPYQALQDIIAKPFEAAGHAKVTYDVEISPTSFSKMQTQRDDPPFDVTFLSRFFTLRAMNSGLLATIAPGDLPELPNLTKDALADRGAGVAMVLDTMDIMVDNKQVPTPMTSWLDLWRPELKGKIMLPGAVNGAAAFAFIACLIRTIGGDVKSEAAVNETFARLKALKPNVRSFYADGIQPNQLMERSDIAVAPQFAIRIANSTKTMANIVKVTPKEGVLAVPYDLCIPKGTKNLALAKTYLNFTLTNPIQTALAQTLLATPVRPDVVIPPALASLVTTDRDRIWFQDEEFAATKQREWLDRYTREVQS